MLSRRKPGLRLTHALPDLGLPWPEGALRWAAHQPGVSALLLGSQRLANVQAGVEAIGRGPLPAEILATLDDRARLEGLSFMPEMARWCGKIS